jgi:hypothetical protein
MTYGNGATSPAWTGIYRNDDPGDGGGGDPGGSGDGGGQPPAGGGEPAGPKTFTEEQLRGLKPIELLSDEQLKGDPTLGTIPDLDSMARMLVSAQKMVGNPKNYLRRLGPEATPEERQAFFREIGAPEKPDEYGLPELERPEDMPQMSEARINQFREVFHKAGLTKEQANEILSAYSGLEVDVWKQSQETAEQRFTQAQQQLKADWGAAYDERLELAQQVAEKKGEEFLSWMEQRGLDNDPMLIRMLAEIGGNLQDPGLPGGGRNMRTGGRLTPAEALVQINELKTDQQFRERWTNDRAPGHKEAVEQINRLYELAYPGKREAG